MCGQVVCRQAIQVCGQVVSKMCINCTLQFLQINLETDLEIEFISKAVPQLCT